MTAGITAAGITVADVTAAGIIVKNYLDFFPFCSGLRFAAFL